MNRAKLVVMEGIDGSGKSTQYARLSERLSAEGVDYRKIVFPRYDRDSSALIRAYLGGAFGEKPSDVNAYAASTFYAVDRFASFKTDWEAYFENSGGLILADRYTTSNACHQGGKLPEGERQAFFDWLYDFEFDRLGLPQPDLVLYLDTEITLAGKALSQRQESTNTRADIHERDVEYLRQCLKAGRYAAEHYGWQRVRCVQDGAMRPVEDIHEEIYALVRTVLVRQN